MVTDEIVFKTAIIYGDAEEAVCAHTEIYKE